MLGIKLGSRLARDGHLGGAPIAHLSLVDVIAPSTPPGASFDVNTTEADLAGAGTAMDVLAGRPDVIFHLAAVVSGEAESNLELGYRVNVDGTRLLLDAVRAVGDGYRPRVVFASSIAVFGAPFPELIDDDFHLTPLTSYGTQKAISELLLC